MTYDELRAALHAYMARTDAEAVGNEDTALELARVKLNRSFHPEGAAVLVKTLAIAAGVGTLPADFAQADVVSTADGDLTYSAPRDFTRMAGRGETRGAFTVAGTQLLVDGAVTSVALLYYRAADKVSGAASNWLCAGYADVWLWAAIGEQHRFVQDWESSMAADQYASSLAQQAELDSRANKAGGTLRMVSRR